MRIKGTACPNCGEELTPDLEELIPLRSREGTVWNCKICGKEFSAGDMFDVVSFILNIAFGALVFNAVFFLLEVAFPHSNGFTKGIAWIFFFVCFIVGRILFNYFLFYKMYRATKKI